jgi:glucose/arabinose dehydrogenase
LVGALVRIGLIAAMVGTVGIVGIGTGGVAQAAPTLPAGFAVRDMPSGQAELLTDFAFAPDGSYFTTGKNGRVAWVSATGQATTLATLNVLTIQDLGLSGLAVAHDYETSKVIYVNRTLLVGNTRTMRLSAFTVQGATPTSLSPERIIWDLAIPSDVHTITGLVAAPDGTLWVSIGDASDFRFVDPHALKVQDINTGYGKLLHVTPDGRGIASNPYYNAAAPSSWKSRVYASGFRSPFRISLDPATGAPLVGDVGWNVWEEINLVRPGANYGWPCWEGNAPTPGYKDLAGCQGIGNAAPLWTYVHGPQGTSVTGGIVYTGSTYPEKYRGAYFFGDYSSKRVYTLRYNGQGALVTQPEGGGFGVDNGAPVKFAAAPNGDIVYADIMTSRIKRLVYLPGNRPPTAEAVITSVPGDSRSFTFDGSGSSDLDGGALTYSWNFGDGTPAQTGVRVEHTYAGTGSAPVQATLTVTDSQGASATTQVQVVPGNGVPVLTLAAPPSGTTFAVGDPVSLSAQVTDAEDGTTLPVTWSVVQVHCSGGYCHKHTGESLEGPTYGQPFVDHGDDTTLEITASTVDSAGVRAEATYVAEPRLRTLSVSAGTPSAITINGVARATAEVTVGAQVSVIAPAVATDGIATFQSWSDGQPRERSFTMGDADLTLTATYLTPIDRRYAEDAAVRTLLGAPTGPEAGDAALRYRTYAGGRMYWTPKAGAHAVGGAILATYLAGGGHVQFGAPLTDELTAADGKGKYNEFAWNGAAIYWSSATGAHAVYGSIATLWRSLGAERSVHGYPRSSEKATPNGRGRYTNFQNGGIYWLPGTGSRSIHGAIYQTWKALGYEKGPLGFPITDERITPDGAGRYNHFEGGSVYWTARTGAHEIRGAIRTRWQALGWERSYLGYPTSDEFAISGGRRSNFERGYVTWNARTGQVVDRRY